jgi:transposase InsO family protein
LPRLACTGSAALYIEPGSPWENGYCENFNSKLRDEFFNGEIFYSLKEVCVLAERWIGTSQTPAGPIRLRDVPLNP